MKLSKKIPDLYFKVARIPGTWYARSGHVLVFYRHDKDGKPFIDDVMQFYGDNGRETRSTAIRRGHAVIERNEFRGFLSTYVPSQCREAVRAMNIGEVK